MFICSMGIRTSNAKSTHYTHTKSLCTVNTAWWLWICSIQYCCRYINSTCFTEHLCSDTQGFVSCLFSPWERMHSIMNFCPLGSKVEREPQSALRVRREQRSVYLQFKVCVLDLWVCVCVSVCVCVCVGGGGLNATHVLTCWFLWAQGL